MTTIAEMVRAKPDPYTAAIACFSKRDLDREAHRVTFSFADESSLAFQISYAVIDARPDCHSCNNTGLEHDSGAAHPCTDCERGTRP